MKHHNYRRLRAYCFHLKGEYYLDLLHDAYLTWYKKTGRSLFEEHPYVGSKVIRNLYLNEVQRNSFMLKGVIYQKRWLKTEEDTGPTGTYTPTTTLNPHDVLVGNEIGGLLSEEAGMVLDGYSQREVAQQMGISSQLVNYRVNKTRKKLMQYLNPIAGSRVTITKKMSKKQFETVSDEYVRTLEGNDTVDIYVKKVDEAAYNEHGTVDGVMVKLTKD